MLFTVDGAHQSSWPISWQSSSLYYIYLQCIFTFDKAHTRVHNTVRDRFRHYIIYIYIWQGTPEQALAKIKFQVQRLGDLYFNYFVYLICFICFIFLLYFILSTFKSSALVISSPLFSSFFSFLCFPLWQTDRQTDRHTHTHTHIHIQDGRPHALQICARRQGREAEGGLHPQRTHSNKRTHSNLNVFSF
jgi:hypothetical protein